MSPLDDLSAPAGVCGVAEIGFAVRDGTTRLSHLYERNPLRVLFPAPMADDLPVAVLVTTSGGLVAGDRIDVTTTVGEEAAAHITGSAAEKIYGSTGATTEIRQVLSLEAGAWLEFLPPEAILFDRARLRRHTRVELADGAGLLGGGIVVFGRIAMGERFGSGLLHEAWEVYRDGDLVWGDALHMDGDVAATMADPACFAGAEACATLILAPRQGGARGFVDAARAVQQQSAVQGVRARVTAVNGLLVARWLGEAAALRRAYADLACRLRQAAMGLPPRLPRLWHV
ncbi:MAG TPA: urease accessory protein UreD [Stellaceae bacterium]|nr:urease accessory protein UreD [Stellaceae bacterium]